MSREDFRPDSDLDVLAEFKPEARTGLLALAGMELELAAIVGRKVDLIGRSAIEEGRNYIRRKATLSSPETVYASPAPQRSNG